jgi:hypothetical protein
VTDTVGFLQWGLFNLVIIGGLIMAIYGLVHALRVRPEAFTIAGKQTRNTWLLILGIAAVGIFAFPMLLVKLAGIVAAAVYIVDVRPAVSQVGPGRGSQEGPYGPW